MKTIISIRKLVLSFFLIGVFTVTSAGCLKKETPEKKNTEQAENFSPPDTTITQEHVIYPTTSSDSLNHLFQIITSGENVELMKLYPMGYACLMLNNGHYASMTYLFENYVTIKWKGSEIKPKNESEMQLKVAEINMENVTMQEFTTIFNLDCTPRDAGITSATLRMESLLLFKTEAGMIVLLGFKER